MVLFLVSCLPGLPYTNALVKVFKLGERARKDVFTPVPLYVVDPEETESQRQKEFKKTSCIYRFEAAALDRALAAMGTEVASTKSAFLDLIRSNYNTAVLAPQTVNGSGFKLVFNGFRRQNSKFPLSSELAKAWALNAPDGSFFVEWTNHLSGVFAGYIRPDVLGEEFESSSSTLRILDPTQKVAANMDIDDILKTSTSWPRTNALRVAKTQQAFQSAFTNEQAALGKFLTKFITNNLLLDKALTRQYQVRRSQGVLVADPYIAGARIVASGEEITPKIKRALDELALLNSSGSVKAKWAPRVQLKARLTQSEPENTTETLAIVSVPSEVPPAAEPAAPPEPPKVPVKRSYWPMAMGALGLLTVIVLLAGAMRWLRRPKPVSQTIMPATTVLDESLKPITLTCPACQEPVPVHVSTLPITMRWQERALQAERRADAALALMRSKVLPGLFQWAKSKLMRTLVSQRDRLEHNQWIAEKEINDLVKRLDHVHTPMAGRLKAYEERIAQLEEELRIKGEENRALLQARLQAVRRQLTLEQNTGTVAWN